MEITCNPADFNNQVSTPAQSQQVSADGRIVRVGQVVSCVSLKEVRSEYELSLRSQFPSNIFISLILAFQQGVMIIGFVPSAIWGLRTQARKSPNYSCVPILLQPPAPCQVSLHTIIPAISTLPPALSPWIY